MDALAALLTRERLLVELVVFKLVELRQLMLAGETRFLGWAAEEVERAAAAVRATELERAVLVSGLAEDRGLAPDAMTLSLLVEDAPEPWRTVLSESHAALRAASTELADLLTANRRLAEQGSRSLTDTLRRLDASSEPEPAPTTYGPGARWDLAAPRPRVAQSL